MLQPQWEGQKNENLGHRIESLHSRCWNTRNWKKKYGQGIAQLIIATIGLLLCLTIIGVVIGYPMMFVAWIWSLISAATFQDKPITVVVQNVAAPPSE